MPVKTEPFGAISDGRLVTKYRITNKNGMEIGVLDYGCTLQEVTIPCRDGVKRNIEIGYEDAAGYEQGRAFYGALVGRYANRIRNAVFELNGITYQLEANQAGHHLHGIFNKVMFRAEVLEDGVRLNYVSADMEEGIPGTLDFYVTYRLTDDNELKIVYEAVSDKDTIINITNHSYFNLNGDGNIPVTDQRLQVFAESFNEKEDNLMISGRIVPVEGTEIDFREMSVIGDRLVDHNYVVCGEPGLKTAAILECPSTGIRMICKTTQPGIQIYVPNPKWGNAVCMETQHFPDSIHHPEYPTTILRAGEKFSEETIFRFETMR